MAAYLRDCPQLPNIKGLAPSEATTSFQLSPRYPDPRAERAVGFTAGDSSAYASREKIRQVRKA
jgi:hypothetical protein